MRLEQQRTLERVFALLLLVRFTLGHFTRHDDIKILLCVEIVVSRSVQFAKLEMAVIDDIVVELVVGPISSPDPDAELSDRNRTYLDLGGVLEDEVKVSLGSRVDFLVGGLALGPGLCRLGRLWRLVSGSKLYHTPEEMTKCVV